MEKNFGGAVPPHVNHAFGRGPFDAYVTIDRKTLCGASYVALHGDESMTSTQLVTCLSCIAASVGKR